MSAARKSKCAPALGTHGAVSGLELGIESGHFGFIPTNQDPCRIRFDETVTLTLIPTNSYLILPWKDSATLTIRDYRFETVTNLSSPIGLDYDPFTNALIVCMANCYSCGDWQLE